MGKKKDKWSELKAGLKRLIILFALSNGVSDILDIRDTYNLYALDEKANYDYDVAAAKAAGFGRDKNNHLPDLFKKANHPTLSNESIYAEGKGGTWKNNNKEFELSDYLMEDSDRTLDYLGSDSLNANVTPTYKGGIVLPTVYVTPKGTESDMKPSALGSGYVYKDRENYYRNGGKLFHKYDGEEEQTLLMNNPYVVYNGENIYYNKENPLDESILRKASKDFQRGYYNYMYQDPQGWFWANRPDLNPKLEATLVDEDTDTYKVEQPFLYNGLEVEITAPAPVKKYADPTPLENLKTNLIEPVKNFFSVNFGEGVAEDDPYYNLLMNFLPTPTYQELALNVGQKQYYYNGLWNTEPEPTALDKAKEIGYWTPYVGDVLFANDIAESIKNKNYEEAALMAGLLAFPYGNKIKQYGKKVSKNIRDKFKEYKRIRRDYKTNYNVYLDPLDLEQNNIIPRLEGYPIAFPVDTRKVNLIPEQNGVSKVYTETTPLLFTLPEKEIKGNMTNFLSSLKMIATNSPSVNTLDHVPIYLVSDANGNFRYVSPNEFYKATALNYTLNDPIIQQEISNYVNNLNNIIGNSGIVLGSNVSISKGLYGGLPHDTEFITTVKRLPDLEKKLKFKYNRDLTKVKGKNGSSPLVQGKDLSVDIQIIEEDNKGLAIGLIAHEIYKAFHPKEYAEYLKKTWGNDMKLHDKDVIFKPIVRPDGTVVKAEDLFEELLKNKKNTPHIENAIVGALNEKMIARKKLLIANPNITALEYENMLRNNVSGYIGGYTSSVQAFKNLNFLNIEANKEFLRKIGVSETYANDPNVMQKIMEDYFCCTTVSHRNVSPHFGGRTTYKDLDGLEKALNTNWSPLNSTGSGGGGNNVLIGTGSGGLGGLHWGTLQHEFFNEVAATITTPLDYYELIHNLAKPIPEKELNELSNLFGRKLKQNYTYADLLSELGYINSSDVTDKASKIIKRKFQVSSYYGRTPYLAKYNAESVTNWGVAPEVYPIELSNIWTKSENQKINNFKPVSYETISDLELTEYTKNLKEYYEDYIKYLQDPNVDILEKIASIPTASAYNNNKQILGFADSGLGRTNVNLFPSYLNIDYKTMTPLFYFDVLKELEHADRVEKYKRFRDNVPNVLAPGLVITGIPTVVGYMIYKEGDSNVNEQSEQSEIPTQIPIEKQDEIRIWIKSYNETPYNKDTRKIKEELYWRLYNNGLRQNALGKFEVPEYFENKYSFGGHLHNGESDTSFLNTLDYYVDKAEPYAAGVGLASDFIGLAAASTGVGILPGSIVAGVGNVPNLLIDGYLAIRDWQKVYNSKYNKPVGSALWNTGEVALDILGIGAATKLFKLGATYTKLLKQRAAYEKARRQGKKIILMKKGLTDAQAAAVIAENAANAAANTVDVINSKKLYQEQIKKEANPGIFMLSGIPDAYDIYDVIQKKSTGGPLYPFSFSHNPYWKTPVVRY